MSVDSAHVSYSTIPGLHRWNVLDRLNKESDFLRMQNWMRYLGEKFRDEILNGEIFYTLKEATVLIERWRWYGNTVRPRSSLDD